MRSLRRARRPGSLGAPTTTPGRSGNTRNWWDRRIWGRPPIREPRRRPIVTPTSEDAAVTFRHPPLQVLEVDWDKHLVEELTDEVACHRRGRLADRHGQRQRPDATAIRADSSAATGIRSASSRWAPCMAAWSLALEWVSLRLDWWRLRRAAPALWTLYRGKLAVGSPGRPLDL